MNLLNEEAIKSNLNTKIIGKNIIILDSVDSTNTYLKELGSQGAEEGTVVITTEQTAGKGRLGRSWESQKGKSLAISILLRPDKINISDCAITPLTGLAVANAINDLCLTDCKIKWPNDIIIGSKKLCGILTEVSMSGTDVDYTVTGIGINVGNSVFSEKIQHKATSILKETGRHADLNSLVATILNYFEKYVIGNHLYLTGESIVEYRNMCATIGRQVMFNRGNRDISGMAAGVNNKGELEVMLSDGTIARVNSGEVTVQGIY